MSCVRFFRLFSALFIFWNYTAKAHGPHEHGHAKLNVVIEDKIITLEFEAPAESMYGFEHKPITAAEKQSINKAVQDFKRNLSSLVILEAALKCTFDEPLITPMTKEEHEGSGEHSEFQAKITAKCAKSPTNSKMSFGFNKHFPGIREIGVQLLNGDKQSGIEIQKNNGELTL